jgi:hypothetical protein
MGCCIWDVCIIPIGIILSFQYVPIWVVFPVNASFVTVIVLDFLYILTLIFPDYGSLRRSVSSLACRLFGF